MSPRFGSGKNPGMLRTATRWSLYFAAALAVGPLAGWLVASIPAEDGGADATGLVSAAPVVGLAKCAAAVAIATVMGIVAAKFCGGRPGMTSAGLVMCWGAWSSGRSEMILRRAGSADPLWWMALETGVLGLLMLAGIKLILEAGRPRAHDPSDSEPLRFSGRAASAFGAALLSALICTWLFAQSDRHGQTFGAAAAAGLFGTLAGRMVAPRMPLMVFASAGVAAGVVSLLVAALTAGPDFLEMLYAGQLLPLGRPVPLDWLAGVLIGVPLGAAWAGSMIERHAHDERLAVTPGAG